MTAMGRLARFWNLLRWWSGDDAYERYCAEHRGHGHALLTKREFYRDYFNRAGRKPRCC